MPQKTNNTLSSDTHGSLMEETPIASLPKELLCELLFQAHNDSEGSQSTSLVVSQVCSAWRGVAIDLPWLWTKLRITQINDKVLEDILQRSHGRPLDITIFLTDSTPENFGLWNTMILLAGEMKRCYRLKVSATSTTYRVMRTAWVRNLEVPSLGCLILQRQGKRDEECIFPSVVFDSEVLVSVALDGVALQPSANLNGVKTLSMKNVNASWFPDCLGLENALEDLHLSHTSFRWSGRTLRTPHLTSVKLRAQNPYEFLQAAWHTPALKYLTIARLSPANWEELVFFLRLHHAGPHPPKLASVVDLTIEECRTAEIMGNGEEVAAFIQQSPGLRRLNFQGMGAHPEPVLEAHDVWGGWPLLTDVYANGARTTRRRDNHELWRYERVREENSGLRTDA